jgi:protein SCO1/2
MIRQTQFLVLSAVAALFTASMAIAQEPIEIGIDEQLGKVLPLETFTFNDEDGKPIVLKELFDRPVVLTLVYFRCPSICTPLLQELVKNVNNCDLAPGEDYRMVTISFDPTETPDLAKTKKANFIATVDKKEIGPQDWRWLTGDADTIRRITDAVGFHYVKDKNKVDYVHAATVIFISSEGQIVRYLNGVQFNPADLKLAVIDATQGRARSFMRTVQALCYTYDPASRGYVLQLNRIILGITVIFVMGFGGFLLFKKGRHSEPASQHGGDPE